MYAWNPVETADDVVLRVRRLQQNLRSGDDRKTVLQGIREARRTLNDLERDMLNQDDGVLGDAI